MSSQLPKIVTNDQNQESEERSSRDPSPVPELPSKSSRKRASVALQRRSSASKPSHDIRTACLGIPPHLSDEEKLNLMFEICFHHSLRTVTDKSDADQDTLEEFTRAMRASVPELLETFKASETYASWLQNQPQDTPTNVQEDNEFRQQAKMCKLESKAWVGAKMKARLEFEEARKEFSQVAKGIEVISEKQRSHLPEEYQQFLQRKLNRDALVARREKLLDQLVKASREVENWNAQVVQRSEACQGVILSNIRRLGESLELHVDHASIIDDFYNIS